MRRAGRHALGKRPCLERNAALEDSIGERVDAKDVGTVLDFPVLAHAVEDVVVQSRLIGLVPSLRIQGDDGVWKA